MPGSKISKLNNLLVSLAFLAYKEYEEDTKDSRNKHVLVKKWSNFLDVLLIFEGLFD